eukprot:5206272-Ditylum_brightwellii.AAC.1
MLGNMIWDSLTRKFQIELMAKEKNFKQGDNFDGALLWHQIVTQQVNMSTKAAIENIEDKLETAKMDELGMIEVRKGGYTKYLCSLFCTYKTAKDKEFLKAIKDKETKWVTGDLPDVYKKAASKLEGSANQKKPANEDTKFLAMMTNLEQLEKAMEMARVNPTPKPKTRDMEKGLVLRFRPWQLENKEGKETLQMHNRTYCWYTNDCHPKPMWCICTNCLSRKDFVAKIAKERKGGGRGRDTKKMKATNNFCIALLAICPTYLPPQT